MEGPNNILERIFCYVTTVEKLLTEAEIPMPKRSGVQDFEAFARNIYITSSEDDVLSFKNLPPDLTLTPRRRDELEDFLTYSLYIRRTVREEYINFDEAISFVKTHNFEMLNRLVGIDKIIELFTTFKVFERTGKNIWVQRLGRCKSF